MGRMEIARPPTQWDKMSHASPLGTDVNSESTILSRFLAHGNLFVNQVPPMPLLRS